MDIINDTANTLNFLVIIMDCYICHAHTVHTVIQYRPKRSGRVWKTNKDISDYSFFWISQRFTASFFRREWKNRELMHKSTKKGWQRKKRNKKDRVLTLPNRFGSRFFSLPCFCILIKLVILADLGDSDLRSTNFNHLVVA